MSKRDVRMLTQFKSGKPDVARPADDPVTLGLDGSVKINMAKLQPPRNVYDADVAWAVQRKPDFVSLFFAKENINDARTFRTRVEIKYPAEAFVGHFWQNSREFHQIIKNDSFPSDEKRLPVEELMGRAAERDHSEWANFEVIARNGLHSCLDFYLMSPSGLARLASGGGSDWLQAAGILRVYTSTFEVRSLLDLCEPIAGKLEPLVRTELSEAKS